MIHNTPPIDNNNDDLYNVKNKNNQNSKSIGKGSFEKSDSVKYSIEEKSMVHQSKLDILKPNIDKPVNNILQEHNFKEANEIISNSIEFFDEADKTAKSFYDEVKTGKISEETRKTLNDNISSLQNTQKYLAYLAGYNVSNSEAKDLIFGGMGLNIKQQEAAKVLLDNKQTLAYVNQKHVANKIKVLVDSGFNKQQAVAILTLSPSNNSDVLLTGTNQSKILKKLGFDKEQINNLININKKSKYPLQKQLLNKMGFDNDTTKILQVLTNKESLKAQEMMIKTATPEAIVVLNNIIEQFEALKQPAFDMEGFNHSLARLYALLSELSKSLAKGEFASRDTKFGMALAAVKQKEIQAEKIMETATKEFAGALIANMATIVASMIQIKMISKAPPATVNAVSIKAQAIGSAITASGGIGKAFMDYEAAKSRAEQKESEALELLYNTHANELGELMQSQKEDLSKTLSTISDIEKSHANINKTLVAM